MAHKFLSPTHDIVFKKIFGAEERKPLLISFLNAVLGFVGDRRIQDLHLVDPYQVPKIRDFKETTLDIKAKDYTGQEFIVEMQVQRRGDFAKRALYYASKSYAGQLHKTDDYETLKPVYFVGVLGYIFLTDPADAAQYLSKHIIRNAQTDVQTITDFQFHFLELPKFTKPLAECISIIDQRAYFLKNTDEDTLSAPTQFDPLIEQAYETVEQYSFSDQELHAIEYREIRENEFYSKGKKEGKEEGKAEGKAEILQKMRDAGMSEAQITAILT